MTTLESTLVQVRTARAQIDPARVFALVLMVLPWLIGWTLRKTVIGVWWVVSYLYAAGQVGWRAASPSEERGG